MLGLRGRAETAAADARITRDLLSWTAESAELGLRVWRPHRQVAFGRQDEQAPGFEAAAGAAREHGYEVMGREVGGHAVAYTGRTAAFVRTEPIEDIRSGLTDRYEAVTTAVQRACWRLGAPVQRGEPANTFCPGSHALSGDGKLVGVAQRVTGEAALVAGIVLIDDHDAVASVLEPVYEALDIPFEPSTVGSLARAGGRTAWSSVRGELEEVLADDSPMEVRRADGQPFDRS